MSPYAPAAVRWRWILLLPLAAAFLCMAIGVRLRAPDPSLRVAPEFAAPPSLIATPPPGAVPGAFLLDTWRELCRDGFFLALGALLLVATLVAIVKPDAQRRLRASALFLLAYLVTMPVCGYLLSRGLLVPYGWARTMGLFLIVWNGTNLVATLGFDVVLVVVHLPARPIFRDLFTGAGYLVATLVTLTWAGVDLMPVLTGSALVAGLIGLSIQSTLADAVGGIILEWEDSLEAGDWVKIGDVNGQVKEIRWRHVRIETRNWESVLLPNSVVTKSNVVVLGRRDGQPRQWRRWIYFYVDYRHPPNEVIGLTNAALHSAPIERVAAEPRPHCILSDMREHAALYAVRYWLTDIAVDDPTDSIVRTRVLLALRRAGIELAIPSRDLRMTATTDEAERKREQVQALESRTTALHRYGLFSPLTEAELSKVVAALSHAVFCKGEVMTRQGAEAHWLYLLVKGEASVQVQAGTGPSKSVARLVAPDYFGEMALLTGERRIASVVAESDCECWRLDRQVFKEIVQARPEVAGELSQILAARRLQTEQSMAAGGPKPSLAAEERRLLDAITSFFGL
jgi:small-conductance mechanosensitive channel/CRP-like cAMP-binding protein